MASLEDFSPEEIAGMAQTYHAILTNPETRSIGLQATKKVNPELPIPELDLRSQAMAEFQRRDAKLAELENQLRMRDAQDRVREERNRLTDKGFSKDEVSSIEKMMMEKSIPSYETAAEFYKSQQQAATPAPYNPGRPQTFSMPQDAMGALKGGKNGLRDWARDQAASALNDIRSGRIQLA